MSEIRDADLVERVNHPLHYGGADNPYEAIKVIEAWQLGFHLGNAVKYICRAGKKVIDVSMLAHESDRVVRRAAMIEDLKKARWYLDRFIDQNDLSQR